MVLKRVGFVIVLLVSACERQTDDSAAPVAPRTVGELLPSRSPANPAAGIVPKPQDQAQLDRMILAGYTPHADHLHAPGLNECPLTKGADVVM